MFEKQQTSGAYLTVSLILEVPITMTSPSLSWCDELDGILDPLTVEPNFERSVRVIFSCTTSSSNGVDSIVKLA